MHPGNAGLPPTLEKILRKAGRISATNRGGPAKFFGGRATVTILRLGLTASLSTGTLNWELALSDRTK